MSKDGTIHRTKEGYEIVFERYLAHAPERVWAMITDPAQISRWYTRTDIEPRAGGKLVEHHDHIGMAMTGVVTRFEPPRYFEHTWWAEEDDPTAPASILWELTPEGSGTRLVLRNRLSELEDAHMTMAGWHIFVDVLAAVLDGADPREHERPTGTYSEGTFTWTDPGRGRWLDRAAVEESYRRRLAETTV